MVSFTKRLVRNRKGQGLVEYAILVAGVALISLVAVSVLGHKTSAMIGTLAAILPGTDSRDSGALVSGSLIETSNTGSDIVIDPTAATTSGDTDRLDFNTGLQTTVTTTSVLAIDVDAT
jgi:Flp pilus assembly pilin Flp